MNWIEITNISQIDDLKYSSNDNRVIVFKHSTRCSISSLALSKFERNWNYDDVTPYFLDLINYRDISNHIAEVFNVEHQSPQLLVVENGQCVNHASHNSISSIDLTIV
jgi:bacillithiol system protein YtxJ